MHEENRKAKEPMKDPSNQIAKVNIHYSNCIIISAFWKRLTSPRCHLVDVNSGSSFLPQRDIHQWATVRSLSTLLQPVCTPWNSKALVSYLHQLEILKLFLGNSFHSRGRALVHSICIDLAVLSELHENRNRKKTKVQLDVFEYSSCWQPWWV